MPFELDHLFILAKLDAPVAEQLIALGLTEGSRNIHPGQGTANRRFFFGNAMLELLWVQDEQEARSGPIAPTRLWERSRHPQTGASPFGICLRATVAATSLPFATWSYGPPYLPPGLEIPVAKTPPAEPMLFSIPFGGRPDAYPPERREPLDHRLGVREITALRVTLPGLDALSAPLRAVERLGIARFIPGDEPLIEISLDHAPRGRTADLRPELPLVLRW
jgi:hypothetical protein